MFFETAPPINRLLARLAKTPRKALGPVRLRPGDDVLGVVDDGVVVEDQRRDVIVAGQMLDTPASGPEWIGSETAERPDDLGLVARRHKCVVRVPTRVAFAWSECPITDVELHARN